MYVIFIEMPSLLNHNKGKSHSKWGKLKMPSGTFFGEIINQQPDKYGQLFYNNDDMYDGEFDNALPGGSGELLYHKGGGYVGKFKNGLPNGPGVKINSDASAICGEFKDGLANSYSVLVTLGKDVTKTHALTIEKGKAITKPHIIPTENELAKSAINNYRDAFDALNELQDTHTRHIRLNYV